METRSQRHLKYIKVEKQGEIEIDACIINERGSRRIGKRQERLEGGEIERDREEGRERTREREGEREGDIDGVGGKERGR